MATRIFHVLFRANPRHVSSSLGLGNVSLTKVELCTSFCVACHTYVQIACSTYLNAEEIFSGECMFSAHNVLPFWLKCSENCNAISWTFLCILKESTPYK